MNTAGRGVILAIAAVVLGAVILGKGFDDPTAVSTDGAQPTPTQTSSTDDGGGDSTDQGTTDTTDDGATDTTDEATDSTDSTDGTDGVTPTATSLPTGGVVHQAEDVRIMVANGTGVSGLAKQFSDSLVSSEGYVALNPANSVNAPDVAETTVYYLEGYQGDASKIAQALGVSRVQAMPDPPPVEDLLEANVLVELGADLVPG